MTAKGDRDRKSGSEEARNELVNELKYLRSLVRDVGEGYIMRKEGEIETLLGYLESLPPRAVRLASRGWLRELRNLPVKPEKGRLKDLKRIDTLLEEFLDSVIDLHEVERRAARPKSSGKAKGTAVAEPPPAGGEG